MDSRHFLVGLAVGVVLAICGSGLVGPLWGQDAAQSRPRYAFLWPSGNASPTVLDTATGDIYGIAWAGPRASKRLWQKMYMGPPRDGAVAHIKARAKKKW